MTINITGNEMELVNETLLYLDENQLIYNLAHYKHYLFYTGTFSLINHIFDLNTMSNVDEYEYGGSYTIKDSLFFHWATNADSARLSIVNISDINQPVDISEVIFSPSDAIIQYKFYGNTLFALGSDHVFVFDFNNINNPTLLSNVEINTSFGLKSCVVVNNYLIVKDYYSNLWVYDISDLNSPQFLSETENFGCTSQGTGLFYDDENNKLLITDMKNGIADIDVNSLPEFVINEKYGLPGPILSHYEFGNWLLFQTPSGIFTLNKSSLDSSIAKLEGSMSNFSIVSDSTKLITTGKNILKIYSYDDQRICLENEIYIADEWITNCYYYNNYFIIYNSFSGHSLFYQIDENFNPTLIEDKYLGNGNHFYYCPKSPNYSAGFIPIYKLVENFNNYLCFLNAEPPFELVYQNQIEITNNRYIKFLDNDNVIVGVDSLFNLYSFNFPNQFDEYESDIYGFAKIHESYLAVNDISIPNNGKMHFYSYLNQDFNLLYEYNFPPSSVDVSLSEDKNILYEIGYFNVYRYNCDYVPNDDEIAPQTNNYALSNYPNPFHSTSSRGSGTTISFDLPKSGNVDLTIYNIKGQKVKTLTNEKYPKGKHSLIWNGKNDKNQDVSSGVYFYKLNVDGKDVNVRKCLLMK